jgi:Heterokaryon incompatibility protein Het-C
LGYTDVFPHVGMNTRIAVRSGKMIWPLVTGTFGGTDFINSLLRETNDKISQISLTDLNAAVSEAGMHTAQDAIARLRILLQPFPSSETQDSLNQLEMSNQSLGGFGHRWRLPGTQGPGPTISPQDIAQKIYPILALRDKIMKGISEATDTVGVFRDCR